MQYIGESAFASCSRLVQADLPENVVSIDKEAFYYTDIESVSIGRKVEVIGEGAFGSCSALAEVNVDAGDPYYEMKDDMLLKNGETVLLCLRNMSGEVTVPERIKTIPYDAFADCDALTFIQIPASVKTIEYGAFGNYGALTMVVYAGSQAQWDAMDIGEYNNNLLAAKLYINGVAQEGSWRIEDGVLYIEEAVGYKETYTTWMNRRQEIKKVVVADGLTRVGDYALYGCENLTEIVLPDSVTEIGHYAFSGCTSLESIAIPEGVDDIGTNAFEYCTSLKTVFVPVSLEYIRFLTFAGCRSIADVTAEAAVMGYDPSAVGKQTLTVEYGGHKTYLNVYVFGFTSESLTLEGRVAINFYADFPGSGYRPACCSSVRNPMTRLCRRPTMRARA